jgi:hypothetical protein
MGLSVESVKRSGGRTTCAAAYAKQERVASRPNIFSRRMDFKRAGSNLREINGEALLVIGYHNKTITTA